MKTATLLLALISRCGGPNTSCMLPDADQDPIHVDCGGYTSCTIMLPPKAECTQQTYYTVCYVKDQEPDRESGVTP